MIESIIKGQLSLAIDRINRIGCDEKSDEFTIAASSHSIMKGVSSCKRRLEIWNGALLKQEAHDRDAVVCGRLLKRCFTIDVCRVDEFGEGKTTESLKIVVYKASWHHTCSANGKKERCIVIFICLEGECWILIEHSGDSNRVSLLYLFEKERKRTADGLIIKVHQHHVVVHSFVLKVVQDVGLERYRRDKAEMFDETTFHLFNLNKTRNSIHFACNRRSREKWSCVLMLMLVLTPRTLRYFESAA